MTKCSPKLRRLIVQLRMQATKRGLTKRGSTKREPIVLNRINEFAVLTAAAVLCALWVVPEPLRAHSQNQSDWLVGLTNGTVIRVEIPAGQFAWRDVMPGNSGGQQIVPFSEIAALSISPDALNQQVEQIESLVKQLDDASWEVRERAESLLLKVNFNQASRDVLTNYRNSQNDEVRVRVERILASPNVKTSQAVSPEQFDWMTLRGGRVVRGDAGDFQFEVPFHGTQLKLSRRQVQFIRTPDIMSTPLAADGDVVETRILADPPNDSANLLTVNFDTDPLGQDRPDKSNISAQFIEQGMQFSTEFEGFIGVRYYTINSESFPVGGKSICPYEIRSETLRPYRGVTKIEFCRNGLPTMIGGVTRLGFVAGPIDHPRDFIMQAFNEDGHLLGTVEANRFKFAYFGIESNEPIAFVRFLSNPYLFHLERRIDEDYAIDGLAIDRPRPALPFQSDDTNFVRTKSGEIFSGTDIAFDVQGGCTIVENLLQRKIALAPQDIESVVLTNFKPRRPTPKSDRWFAMLRDRSVIEVRPGESFVPVRFGSQPLEPDRVVAVWSDRDFLRFPLGGDFDQAKLVLVFPTARVLTNTLEIDSEQVSWKTPDARTVLQPVTLPASTQGPSSEEDPAPQFNQIAWQEPTETQLPSIWFRHPVTKNPNHGSVSLRNGEILVFGDGASFAAANATTSGIRMVDSNGQVVELVWSEIWRVKF